MKKQYTHLTEEEFKTIKLMTDTGLPVRAIAKAVKRASSTVALIKRAKDMQEYKELTIRSKHSDYDKLKQVKVLEIEQKTMPELERIAIALENLVEAFNNTQDNGKKKGWLK